MKRKGTGFMILGAVLILAAGILTGYNILESHRAEKNAVQAVRVLREEISPAETVPSETETPVAEIPTAPSVPDYVLFPDMEMPVLRVNGQDYVGMVTIPTLNLELPVISQWSYAALKIAPCRYEGSAYTGDLILMAHNFESHFGKIKELRPEDRVLFTDMDGNVFSYRVVDMETLPSTAIEEMSAGEWDLTLFTCTYGGRSRVTIRCELVENQ